MGNPYQVVRDFELEVCRYTGAPYCVAVNSCTAALMLSVQWFNYMRGGLRSEIEIPKRTYVSVPMAIMHAGDVPTFREEEWEGYYSLKPLPVIDSARFFRGGMWKVMEGNFICVSFHASKILGDTQGGAILHYDSDADRWLRKMRFDGRTEGISPKFDNINMLGHHCYMSPDVAARLTLKLHSLPKENAPLPNDDYPDLSQMEIFK